MSVEISADGTIFVEENCHRTTFSPGSDVSAQHQEVIDIANEIWTPEVVAAYQLKTNPPKTIEENVMACCKEIIDFAGAKYAAGLAYGGNTYQLTIESQKLVGLRAIYAMNSITDPINFPWGDPYNKGWWDTDNAYHAMTAAEFMAFARAVSDYCSCIACCCRDHKNAVTAENCATYDYSGGWPVQP